MTDQILKRAAQLRLVLSLPEYEQTIGKFINDALEAAQHELEIAEVTNFQRAQGAHAALKSITDQINRTLVGANKAQEKLEKKNLKDQL